VAVRVVVSRGPDFEVTNPPQLVGRSVAEVLAVLKETKVVFDFEARPATGAERPGQVVWQETTEATVPNGTRIKAALGVAPAATTGLIYGVFRAEERAFPYPIPVELRGTSGGRTTVIVAMDHPGGLVTLPYAVAPGTELSLVVAGTVLEAEVAR
jgi:beta-lactam-binding protein with PASTA domain